MEAERLADAIVDLHFSQVDAQEPVYREDVMSGGDCEAWEKAEDRLAPGLKEAKDAFYKTWALIRAHLPADVAKHLTFGLERHASAWAAGESEASFILGKAVGRKQRESSQGMMH